jgi:hypothetical protein
MYCVKDKMYKKDKKMYISNLKIYIVYYILCVGENYHIIHVQKYISYKINFKKSQK